MLKNKQELTYSVSLLPTYKWRAYQTQSNLFVPWEITVITHWGPATDGFIAIDSVMVCPVFSAKSLPQTMLICCQWNNLKNEIRYKKSYLINTFKCVVCNKNAILFKSYCVELLTVASNSWTEPGACLTNGYGVTIQMYRNWHAIIKDSKIYILRCVASKCSVKFQRCTLKFHKKIWTHTHQKLHFTRCWNLTTYDILELWHLKS